MPGPIVNDEISLRGLPNASALIAIDAPASSAPSNRTLTSGTSTTRRYPAWPRPACRRTGGRRRAVGGRRVDTEALRTLRDQRSFAAARRALVAAALAAWT